MAAVSTGLLAAVPCTHEQCGRARSGCARAELRQPVASLTCVATRYAYARLATRAEASLMAALPPCRSCCCCSRDACDASCCPRRVCSALTYGVAWAATDACRQRTASTTSAGSHASEVHALAGRGAPSQHAAPPHLVGEGPGAAAVTVRSGEWVGLRRRASSSTGLSHGCGRAAWPDGARGVRARRAGRGPRAERRSAGDRAGGPAEEHLVASAEAGGHVAGAPDARCEVQLLVEALAQRGQGKGLPQLAAPAVRGRSISSRSRTQHAASGEAAGARELAPRLLQQRRWEERSARRGDEQEDQERRGGGSWQA